MVGTPAWTVFQRNFLQQRNELGISVFCWSSCVSGGQFFVSFGVVLAVGWKVCAGRGQRWASTGRRRLSGFRGNFFSGPKQAGIGHDSQCFAGDRRSGTFRFFQVSSGFSSFTRVGWAFGFVRMCSRPFGVRRAGQAGGRPGSDEARAAESRHPILPLLLPGADAGRPPSAAVQITALAF